MKRRFRLQKKKICLTDSAYRSRCLPESVCTCGIDSGRKLLIFICRLCSSVNYDSLQFDNEANYLFINISNFFIKENIIKYLKNCFSKN